MSTRYRTGNLIPVQSRFSKLPAKLAQMRANDFFDAVILETGISNIQWSDSDRGFCPRRKGKQLKRDLNTGHANHMTID